MENSRYKKLRKEGAFILMSEWINRWKEVFQEELGFKTEERATEFMKEMHTKVIYLDTGNQEIPYQTLEDISTFVGLPYSIEKSNPSILSKEITKAINYVSHAE